LSPFSQGRAFAPLALHHFEARIRAESPTFWLPERILLNLIFGYSFNDAWSAQPNVDNVLDDDYLQAAVGRTTVIVGSPRNIRARSTYKF
jgi:outer membrane receptor for ferric coprogen and ferric-rhodotorulic acid